MYILSSPARTRFLYNLVGEKLLSMSGIQFHTGKTRCWNRMGQPPPDMEVLGPEVWSPEVWSPGEIKVLGTPLGSAEFEQETSNQRLQEERKLWEPSSGYLICSALGKSSCNVPVLGATTLCERCLMAVRRLMRKVTTKECQELWAPCWAAFREQKGSTR